MSRVVNRSTAGLIVGALLALTVAGCGFRPLYGSHAGDPRVTTEMSAIYISPMADREGQLVHNALLVRFNRNGAPDRSRFQLDVQVQSNEGQTAVARDATATRAVVSYSASYTLSEGQTTLTSGSFGRIFSYDYVPQQYSNISARADVARRAAEEIADEVRNRIASYFAAGAKARAAATLAPAN